MAYPTDGFAAKRVKDAFQTGNLGDISEFTLFKIGTINIETGENIACFPTPIPLTVSIPLEREVK